MATKKTKAVTKTKDNLPADPNLADWGEADYGSTNDIIIPKLLLMQGLSDKVVNGEAKLGEVRDTANDDLHADFSKAVEVIPFYMFKAWVIKENDEFKRVEPITADNDNWPYNETIDGVEISRDRTLYLYCLLPGELSGLPFIMPFRRTTLKMGRIIDTQMYTTNRMAKLSPAGYTFVLQPTKTKNDKGTFAVYEVKKGRLTTEEERSTALEWLKTVRAGKTKMDNRDESQEEVKDGPSQF